MADSTQPETRAAAPPATTADLSESPLLPSPPSLAPSEPSVVLLVLNNDLYPCFQPFPIKNGGTTDPQDTLFLYDTEAKYGVANLEEPDVIQEIYEGPIDHFVQNIKAVFNMTGSVVLSVPELQLSFHEVGIHHGTDTKVSTNKTGLDLHSVNLCQETARFVHGLVLVQKDAAFHDPNDASADRRAGN